MPVETATAFQNIGLRATFEGQRKIGGSRQFTEEQLPHPPAIFWSRRYRKQVLTALILPAAQLSM
jgi:hypothetical protein